ncbi:claret isoform a [Anaeramoeba ignava]|uniref:Claret isoform a n=1 Tax=Anaeramoeba ignava TaxID=1746090 RepID=A0A9Q0LTG7_ANAIG|nr:claret isoform a [Anaeramoeba ignava]
MSQKNENIIDQKENENENENEKQKEKVTKENKERIKKMENTFNSLIQLYQKIRNSNLIFKSIFFITETFLLFLEMILVPIISAFLNIGLFLIQRFKKNPKFTLTTKFSDESLKFKMNEEKIPKKETEQFPEIIQSILEKMKNFLYSNFEPKKIQKKAKNQEHKIELKNFEDVSEEIKSEIKFMKEFCFGLTWDELEDQKEEQLDDKQFLDIVSKTIKLNCESLKDELDSHIKLIGKNFEPKKIEIPKDIVSKVFSKNWLFFFVRDLKTLLFSLLYFPIYYIDHKTKTSKKEGIFHFLKNTINKLKAKIDSLISKYISKKEIGEQIFVDLLDFIFKNFAEMQKLILKQFWLIRDKEFKNLTKKKKDFLKLSEKSEIYQKIIFEVANYQKTCESFISYFDKIQNKLENYSQDSLVHLKSEGIDSIKNQISETKTQILRNIGNHAVDILVEIQQKTFQLIQNLVSDSINQKIFNDQEIFNSFNFQNILLVLQNVSENIINSKKYKTKTYKNESIKITKPIQFKFENENENENEKQIKQISSGYFSTIFLFKNGKAIEYLNNEDLNENPEKIQIENIQKVIVGYQNEAILTKEGNLFAKGKDINPYNPNEFINISSLIEDTNDRIIQDIVSGSRSIYLLTSNQNVYGIGANYDGQLGFDSKTLEITEKPILMMKNVSKIFSGNNSFHVFLLNSNQELFGCGYNSDGQLGLGESRKEETRIQKLTKIQNIPKGKIIDIKCGISFSIMLIENQNENPERKLYSCGDCSLNGIGIFLRTIDQFIEIKSSLFENDDNILDFSVGYSHNLILTSNSKLIGFGNNEFGELGTGDTKNQPIPIQIELPKLRFNEDISNYHVSCGYFNSFLYYSPPSFSNLEEDLIKLFRRKEFCDISFKTENGEIIEAHKLILKYRLNQNENQIEKLQEIISNKSIKESNQIFEMIYSNRIINPKLYSEIKEIINLNEKIEETIKRIYLNENEKENEKDFIIERKEKQYKFPKLILIMRSELYRGMFLSVTEDKSNKVTDYSELRNFGTIFLFENGKAIEYLNKDDSNPKPEKIQIEENIQKVTVGHENEVILTKEGNLFAKGKDINPNNPNEFINISSLIEDKNDRIIQDIVSGANSIYLLTSNQNVYGIGSNFDGQLGFDSETFEITEKPILMMKNVSKIFSGNNSYHVFLLNSNQELFGCGDNRFGQLGLGESTEEKEINKLTKIQNIPKGKIIDIQTGYYHSIMLIENENQNENPKRKLYSCGFSLYNGLGTNTYEFTEIKSSLFENDDYILEISCGSDHTLILTSKPKLIGFGSNSWAQLGTRDRNNQQIPIKIELPKLRFNEDIFNYHIYCGFNKSFLYYSPFLSPFSNIEEDLIKLFERKEFCNISFKTRKWRNN